MTGSSILSPKRTQSFLLQSDTDRRKLTNRAKLNIKKLHVAPNKNTRNISFLVNFSVPGKVREAVAGLSSAVIVVCTEDTNPSKEYFLDILEIERVFL